MQRKTLALAVTLALAASSFQANAQDARDAELAALKQQLAALVEKVQELEARTDAQSDVNVDTATQLDNLSNNVAKVETKGGIKVTSADKNFEASVGGRIHFDAYAFDKDGVIFANRERILPAHPRGYYREYTVAEPDARNRGPRRIVCGGPRQQPDACYYSADHYASFQKIEP